MRHQLPFEWILDEAMRAVSSSESARNSAAVPTFHPAVVSPSIFDLFIYLTSPKLIVRTEPCIAAVDDALWGAAALLGKHLYDDDCVCIDAVDNPPVLLGIKNPQLVTQTEES